MSTSLRYRILNVFTDGDDPFSGNPLCVFEDATGLSDNEMQSLARQLNLSETTFVTAGDSGVSANVRIFTPNYEMPFAGHPTLGTAHDVRAASADPRLLARFGTRPDGEALVYLWAPTGPDTIEARLFFTQNHAVVEDPATGSACANLGGWFLANGQRGIRRHIHQGSAIQRPSVLDLMVDDDSTVFVSGAVREVGRGTFTI